MSRPLALACLLLAATAQSASGLDAARAASEGARSRLSEVRGRQMGLRMELNQLAARIETLKAEQKGALLPGGELDRSLKRSQELSGLLSDAARELAQAESDGQRDHLALLDALTQSLKDLEGRWDRAGRDDRRALLTQLRALRTEREQVRAQLPASAVPALEASSSEDPGELLEQADALRDSEDKVRQRMQALQGRIRELKEERDLDRRMNDFLGEEAMFDEQDRRLRLSRETDSIQAGGSTGTTRNDSATPTTQQLPAGGAFANAPPPGAGSPGAGATGGAGSHTDAPPPQSPSGSLSTARATDARPSVDGVAKGALESEDLKTLEAQLKELAGTAKQLEEKAKQMERRARDMK